MLAWKLGKLDDAQLHFEHALQFEQRMGAKLWVAYTQIEYSRMLMKRNRAEDSGRALDLVQRAIDTASAIGTRLLEVRGHALLRKAGRFETHPSQFEINRRLDRQGLRQRILATIMFIDIVKSTERVAELADRGWVTVQGQFFELLRREVANFGGREINTAGDGMLVIFDNPATGIRSAFATSDGAQSLGLQVRIGIHTGECEIVGNDVAGIAVHIGARVAGWAAANEVIVSSTVKELMAGGDVNFVDRGSQALRGIEGDWHLYAVERPNS
jgi:class 3 adenylate cyclase